MDDRPLVFATLQPNDPVEGVACALRAERKRTRNGAPYLEFQLADRQRRTIRAVKWDVAEDEHVTCPTLVRVAGVVGEYQGQLQLRIARCAVRDGDVAPYLPGPYRDTGTDELWEIIGAITEPALADLVARAVRTYPAFLTAPASVMYHGAYRGGLLEHSVNVARICQAAAAIYGDAVDRDLLVAAALLHDLGKAGVAAEGAADQALREERLIGHVLRGSRMVEELLGQEPALDRERQMHLLHLIASHHGEPEWGAAVRPTTIEALILHHADQLDASVTGARDSLRATSAGEEWVWFAMRKSWLRCPAATGAERRASSPEPVADLTGYDDVPFLR
ncbi:MAG: HD domain-containing protein [Sphaerobacter sp.]|nr:HD domain-containing protein [Sphaerobacter sp.]